MIATARDSADPFVGKIVIGDRVEVTTPFGPRVYRVVQRHTIPAGELDIEPTHEPTLTLVAPYPADAVGPAPLRLVVRARLVDDGLRRAAAVSTYAFVNPVVALLLAWAVGDGELSARTAVAAALVVGAVVFSREPARREEPEVVEGATLERAIPSLRRPTRGGLAALFR